MDVAFEALRRAIEERVEVEQVTDPTTGLYNNVALNEWIRAALGGRFWIAFLEVDKFKSINDRFGYDDADEVLKAIAETLRGAAASFHGAAGYRAHGDEFYLGGLYDEHQAMDVAAFVDGVRAEIERLVVPAASRAADIHATVSVGWLDFKVFDAPAPDGVEQITDERRVRRCLELAVSAAKAAGRNRTVQFDPAMREPDTFDHRTDCAACESKASLVVKRELVTAPRILKCSICHVEMGTLEPPEPR